MEDRNKGYAKVDERGKRGIDEPTDGLYVERACRITWQYSLKLKSDLTKDGRVMLFSACVILRNGRK